VPSKAWTNLRPGLYSAWNWSTGQYDYYQARRPTRGYGERIEPPPAQLGGILGEDPDVSGHVLPFGARRVGSGSQAMGEIVSLPRTPVGFAALAGATMAVAAPIFLLLGMIKAWELGRSR
jgi:hypothetical protein